MASCRGQGSHVSENVGGAKLVQTAPQNLGRALAEELPACPDVVACVLEFDGSKGNVQRWSAIRLTQKVKFENAIDEFRIHRKGAVGEGVLRFAWEGAQWEHVVSARHLRVGSVRRACQDVSVLAVVRRPAANSSSSLVLNRLSRTFQRLPCIERLLPPCFSGGEPTGTSRTLTGDIEDSFGTVSGC